MNQNFTIGCDPEFFIKESNGQIISAVGIVGGTKESPLVISKNCSVHEDNVALEITIPPSSSKEEFQDTLSTAIKEANKQFDGISLEIKASHIFTNDQLKSRGAMEFGCSADYDAYDSSVNIPINPKDTNLRSCGGHIHVGYDKWTINSNKSIVLMMDLFLGVPSILLDKDERRRDLYGKASAYRDTTFGLEYRVLSNFWTKSKESIDWAYESVVTVMNLYFDEIDISNEDLVSARLAINSKDKDLARKLIKKYKIKLPTLKN